MINSILGKKIGMTQFFDEKGNCIPVTLLEAGPSVVQDVKTIARNGYTAVQLGFGDKKEKSLKKPQREDLKKKNLKPKQYVKEVRVSGESELKVGDAVDCSVFQKGDYLDIIGISKGKGFQGGMKRCNWKGGCDTHGSMSHRAPGSIGASTFPSRVVKGHGFPGQMGNEQVTVQNLEVVDVDQKNLTIAVRGAVPGPNGNFLILRFAKKMKIAPRKATEVPSAEKNN
jgi:large subunit ribosomal protein L3